MKKSFFGLLAAILAATCLGFASSGSHEMKRGTNVVFASTMKFQNGQTVPAGNYRMVVIGNSQHPTVDFYRRYYSFDSYGTYYGKIVASTAAKVAPEQQKNHRTVIDSVTSGNAQMVAVIRPSGWKEELLFGSGAREF